MGGGNDSITACCANPGGLIVDDPDFALKWATAARGSRRGISARKFDAQIDALPAEVVAGSKRADRRHRSHYRDRPGDGDRRVAFAAYALHEAEKHGRGQVVELLRLTVRPQINADSKPNLKRRHSSLQSIPR